MSIKNLTEEELNLKIKEGEQANYELIRRHVVNRISNEENDKLPKKLEELFKTLEIKSYSFKQIDYMVEQGIKFKLTGDEPVEFFFSIFDDRDRMSYQLGVNFKDSQEYHELQSCEGGPDEITIENWEKVARTLGLDGLRAYDFAAFISDICNAGEYFMFDILLESSDWGSVYDKDYKADFSKNGISVLYSAIEEANLTKASQILAEKKLNISDHSNAALIKAINEKHSVIAEMIFKHPKFDFGSNMMDILEVAAKKLPSFLKVVLEAGQINPATDDNYLIKGCFTEETSGSGGVTDSITVLLADERVLNTETMPELLLRAVILKRIDLTKMLLGSKFVTSDVLTNAYAKAIETGSDKIAEALSQHELFDKTNESFGCMKEVLAAIRKGDEDKALELMENDEFNAEYKNFECIVNATLKSFDRFVPAVLAKEKHIPIIVVREVLNFAVAKKSPDIFAAMFDHDSLQNSCDSWSIISNMAHTLNNCNTPEIIDVIKKNKKFRSSYAKNGDIGAYNELIKRIEGTDE